MFFICSEQLDSKLAAALESLRKERSMSKQQSTPMNFHPYSGTPFLVGMFARPFRVRYPLTEWHFNPWTGFSRPASAVESDPYGRLIVPPFEPIYATTEESALKAVLAAAEAQPTKPMHRPGVHFIAEVPVGAKLLAFNDQIVVVAPGLAPHFVTLTGLTPVPRADGKEQ